MNIRIRWLRDKLNALNIQGMIVSNPVNIKYLTGIEAEGYLLITRKENIYLTDGRYIEYANSVLTIDDEIIVSDIKDFSKEDYEMFFMFCENVGFEEKYVTYDEYKKMLQRYRINLVETDGVIEEHRILKEQEEIENVKKACSLTDSCYRHLLTYIKKGMSERDIAFEIEKFYIRNGADGCSFSPVVAVGANSSKPHHIPTNKRVEAGSVILIDMGCKVNGYCSDCTRTIFMDYVPAKVKPIYDLVLKNNLLAEKEIKEGKDFDQITSYVENDFTFNKFSLIHALRTWCWIRVTRKTICNF